MDPLTIITTAASVVGTAIKLSKSLYDTIESLKDAPSDVKALCATIESVKSAVSRLVAFINDGHRCDWPEQWLDDVMIDIEAIGEELREVQKLVEEWKKERNRGKVKEAWRSWKWYFNTEEIQRSTKRLREAKDDLGFQINVIQLSAAAQTTQEVNEVKDIVGSIKAELEQKRVGFDERALNNKLSDFAKQMSSLRDAITSLGTLEISSGDDDRGYEGPSPKPEIDLPPSILGSNIVKHQEGRLSFDSISSDVSDSILSPLAALNRQAFLQNQQMTGTPYRPGDNTLGTAALSLRLADMQRKHDEVLVHWDNAMGQIVYLKCELERHIHSNFDGHGIERTGDLTPKFDSYDEEIGAREAVIDVLKAQNESLQEMISQRVTIMGYTDSNLDARSIGKQLLEKTERTNRQQEEIDLLKWRLQGEQSSLREQLQVNRILDDEVKSTKRRQENDAIWKRSRRHDSLAPDSRPRQELLAEDSAMMERHRPSSLASNSTITSFLGKLDMYSTMRTQTTFLEDRGKPRRNFHSSRSSNLYPKEVL